MWPLCGEEILGGEVEAERSSEAIAPIQARDVVGMDYSDHHGDSQEWGNCECQPVCLHVSRDDGGKELRTTDTELLHFT